MIKISAEIRLTAIIVHPEIAITASITFRTMFRLISVFGVWGWLDLAGGLIVVIGCAGELWVLLNKIPEHNERRVELKRFWAILNRLELFIRLSCIKLKIIRPRKLSELKEHLLEGFFISLVAFGVGLELLSLPFSLHESATINEVAKQAERDAGQANLQVIVLSNETVRVSLQLEAARSNSWVLAKAVLGLQAQTEQTKTNIENLQIETKIPEIANRLKEARIAAAEVSKSVAEAKDILTSSNLAALSELKPKSLKERIIDCVNSVDKRLVPKLETMSASLTCHGDLDSEHVSELKKLAAESGAWQYLQIIDEPHGFAWMSDGTEQITGFKFVLYPALIKP